MSREVSAHGGTIDKFIGDAVMAFWGAPAANADQPSTPAGVRSRASAPLRESGLTDDGGRPLRVRIGINSGDMLVGNIGSEVRLNYTVIGDAVNVASRLEGANKEYGTEIIIGEETRRLAGERIQVRELDRLMVYGRAAGSRSTSCSASPKTERSPRAGWRCMSSALRPIATAISRTQRLPSAGFGCAAFGSDPRASCSNGARSTSRRRRRLGSDQCDEGEVVKVRAFIERSTRHIGRMQIDENLICRRNRHHMM